MIEATESHFYKAFISFLFETGCRISEARSLKVKDFYDTDQGMIVHIPTTKTAAGYRKVILPFSTQYIRNLKTFTNMKRDDTLFNVSEGGIYGTLKKIAKEAGINKPMSCHKFRHAQATDLVKRGYNEAIIRKKLGWSPTSGMIARYQHLNDEDVINATLENTGKLPQTAAPRTEIREADKVTLVDAAMQSMKEEMEGLKTRQKVLDNFLSEIVGRMDEKSAMTIMFKKKLGMV
jgi:integrase